MPWNSFGYFINPYSFAGETHLLSISLLKFFFLFLFAPLGLYLILKREKTRVKGMLFVMVIVGWAIIYLAHVGISATAIKFTGFSYLKMLFPILIVSSIFFIVELLNKDDQAIKAKKIFKMSIGYILFFTALVFIFIIFFNFSQIPLNQKNIRVITSDNPSSIKFLMDNTISTLWDSGGPQRKGMNITIELDRIYLINRIVMDSSPNPGATPQDVKIFYSQDNIKWDSQDYSTNSGFEPPTSMANLYFPPMNAKFVKIELVKDNPSWWGINELEIYGR
jgi:hypothetical protein